MKIVSVSAHVVNAEMRNWVFVKVQTDVPGLHGWGEATLEWKTRGVAGTIEDLAPLVIGRNPLDIEQAVRAMRMQSFWRLGAIGMSAVSGIELALWDIMGKHFGVPVWQLTGGRTRDRVHVYTHLGFGDMRAVYETDSADPLVERARRGAGARLYRLQGRHPALCPRLCAAQGSRPCRAADGQPARGGRPGHRDHARLPRQARLGRDGARPSSKRSPRSTRCSSRSRSSRATCAACAR